jgi:hypothetical protein
MGLFDRNWGMNRPAREPEQGAALSDDERAIARYRYMLKTAPPEALEQVHAEAFAQLTPEQRRQVLAKLADEAPPAERAAIEQGGANPQALARAATRAEIRQPGVLERVFAPAPMMGGGGGGFGGMLAGSLLGSVAGTVLGSAIAHQFFSHDAHAGGGLDHGAGLFDSGGATAQPATDTSLAGLSDATPGDAPADAGIGRFESGDAPDPNAFEDDSDFGDSDAGVVDSGDFDSGSFDV